MVYCNDNVYDTIFVIAGFEQSE